MTVPTKVSLQDRQVVGYEICNNPFCGWKNVFFEDEDHRPRLIASLGIFGSYLCPKCLSDEHHASRFQFVDSIGSYAEVFPDEFVDSNKREEPPVPPDMRSMSPHQHARAIIRFFFPWEDEGKASVAAISVFYGVLILWGFVFSDFQLIPALLTTYLWIVGLVTGYHFLLVLVSLTMLIGKKEERKQSRSNLLNFWKEMGEDPLFPTYRSQRKERRLSYNFFRLEGMSRKKARRLSRHNH